MAPHYIKSMLVKYQPVRELRSSSQQLLVVPRCKTKTLGTRAFSTCAPKLWNDLPLHLRNASNVNSFKARLKTHLFQNAFNC